MKDPQKTLRAVRENGTLWEALRVLGVVCVCLSVYTFGYLCAVLFVADVWRGVRFVAVCAVPFGVVSLARRLIGAPRPYEVYDLGVVPPRAGRADSFPSRHVFCAVLLGVLACPVSVRLGILTLCAGAVLGVCRVLGGIHFLRDVIAGGVLGAFAGGLGLVFLYL